jgi:steroid delta-isomerase-like uncharacterized protein
MDASWLDRYMDAWLFHPVAGTSGGESELESLLRFFSPKVIYEDVPSSSVFEGHKGIEQMCELANQWSSDLDFNVLTRQTNGSLFSFETETVGTNTSTLGDLPATGRRFVLRGVSVGQVDEEGLVREQRDYWDMGSFLTQIGVLPPFG